jgi:hypothetical protein
MVDESPVVGRRPSSGREYPTSGLPMIRELRLVMKLIEGQTIFGSRNARRLCVRLGDLPNELLRHDLARYHVGPVRGHSEWRSVCCSSWMFSFSARRDSLQDYRAAIQAGRPPILGINGSCLDVTSLGSEDIMHNEALVREILMLWSGDKDASEGRLPPGARRSRASTSSSFSVVIHSGMSIARNVQKSPLAIFRIPVDERGSLCALFWVQRCGRTVGAVSPWLSSARFPHDGQWPIHCGRLETDSPVLRTQ